MLTRVTAIIEGAITENRVYKAPPSFVRKYSLATCANSGRRLVNVRAY